MHRRVPFVLECEGVFCLAGNHHLPQAQPFGTPGTSETGGRPERVFWPGFPQMEALNTARKWLVIDWTRALLIKNKHLVHPNSVAVTTYFVLLLLQEVAGLTLCRVTRSGRQQQVCLQL